MAQLIIEIPDNVLPRLQAVFGEQNTQNIIKQFVIDGLKNHVYKAERKKNDNEFSVSDIDIK